MLSFTPVSLAWILVYIAGLSVAILSTDIGIIVTLGIPIERGAAYCIAIVLSGLVLLMVGVAGLGQPRNRDNRIELGTDLVNDTMTI